MSDERSGIEINWVQASAGALAAVSSAVLLSTVGVAGTIVGAALGSVAATVGSAVYSHYLRVSRDRVAAAAAARTRIRRAHTDLGEAAAELAVGIPHADERLDEAEQDLQRAELKVDAAEDGRASWREAVTGLPWRRLLLAAAGIFLAAMVVIVSFELATGRAVSSFTGGSDRNGPRISVPGLGGGHASPQPTPTASPSATPTGPGSATLAPPGPTAVGTGPATPTVGPTPTSAATPSPSVAATTPTPAPTPSPSTGATPSG
ncbi:MAG: hypothetical protein ACXVWU_04080 [Nocardioides sp.]